MIKAFSQRLLPPFSGQAQIAESDRGRAITMDGETWEFHFVHGRRDAMTSSGTSAPQRSFRRVAYLQHSELAGIAGNDAGGQGGADERIRELAEYVADASLPFPAADRHEYWLLDPKDGAPLALIFSCSEAEQISTFPSLTEWTALPAAVMPVEPTPEEKDRSYGPVNYRFERCVAERAGSNPRARWFTRHAEEEYSFPPYLVSEEWEDEEQRLLCQRYLRRQSTRLLMLHGLEPEERRKMELAAKSYPLEVLRFFALYPEVADQKLMNSIRVEAKLRKAEGQEMDLLDRRDGVLYQ
jgi:hypothetical protein